MKNLQSVAGVTSAEAMGADLVEAEVEMMEKTKDLAGEDSEKVTLNGEINGKDDKDSHTKHLSDSTTNIEITENNSEEKVEEVNVNDEEDKTSFVSLSQSTDFEVSPSIEVFAAKEAEETEDISKHSDITNEDLDDKLGEAEEITSQDSKDPTENYVALDSLNEAKDDGADNNEEDEEERESKLEKKEEVKAVEGDEGEETGQGCTEDAPKEGIKEQEDEEKSSEEISSQMVEEKVDILNSPAKTDEVPEDIIESEVKTEDETMNLVLMSDSEAGEDSREASEEIKVEDKKEENVEETSAVESPDDHDDAYGSDDESMDSIDINKGLQECFKNLEEKIAQEAEEEDSRKRLTASSGEGEGCKDSTETGLPRIEDADTRPNEEEIENCLDKDIEKEKSKAEGSEETERRLQTAEEKMEEEM